MNKYDIFYEICLLGESGVGKSQIVNRYVDGSYSSSKLITVAIDFKIKMIQMDDGKIIKLIIWDTGGAERFRSITKYYIKNAHGIILIYNVRDKSSFNSLCNWLGEIRKNTYSNIPIFLAGIKKMMKIKE